MQKRVRSRGALTATAEVAERLDAELVDEVHVGLDHGQFHVAFQPIVHAQSGALDSVECLLRWQHPHYGLLFPGAFERALSDRSVAHRMSALVLDVACRELRAQRDAGQEIPSVAINVLPSQLLDDRLRTEIDGVTRRYNIQPSSLELELVESEETLALVVTREFTAPIRDMGVRLALDDFGTGYSSLAVLASAHVDSVKLAREFLLGQSSGDPGRTARVMRGAFAMLEDFQLRTVVEGVETGEQLDWLASHTAVYAQGYFVGRPDYVFPSLITCLDNERIE
ncbi:EAL domain-containing protein [Paraburkholderia flava]|uniref:EAL domain-containing protein n=1 Tax=Paraburkholderia flava TaxID=2547393 RepID=UPI00141512E5|nr:EAL domain-containing protein [Paraburkholderia flava]